MSKHVATNYKKALRLRKALDTVADVFKGLIAAIVLLAAVVVLGIIVVGLWEMGLGYLPVVLGVFGVLVGIWLYLSTLAEKQLNRYRQEDR